MNKSYKEMAGVDAGHVMCRPESRVQFQVGFRLNKILLLGLEKDVFLF